MVNVTVASFAAPPLKSNPTAKPSKNIARQIKDGKVTDRGKNDDGLFKIKIIIQKPWMIGVQQPRADRLNSMKPL